MVKKKTTPAKKATTSSQAAKKKTSTAKKKTAVKKAAKKTAKKKTTATKKTAAGKKTAGAAAKKTTSAKKKSAATSKAKAKAEKTSAAVSKTIAPKAASSKPVKPTMSAADRKKRVAARTRVKSRSSRAAAFTLEDVKKELERSRALRAAEAKKNAEIERQKKAEEEKKRLLEEKPEHRKFEAASLADILGFNPVAEEKPKDEESQIPRKFRKYYRLLVELRDHVKNGLDLHTEETLKRSSRDDSGDLSGYGQHMADAGTDTFDRDFALSLVSNEQEALYEIEEAIQRIKKGTYGICELTGEPIDEERLLAVPFARYSVKSQAEVEKLKRRDVQRGGAFGELGDDGPKILSDEDNE